MEVWACSQKHTINNLTQHNNKSQFLPMSPVVKNINSELRITVAYLLFVFFQIFKRNPNLFLEICFKRFFFFKMI